MGGTGRYQVGRRGARLASLVREAAGEVEAAGTPAVAHLMGGAVRDIAALAARPPSASESELLQVCTRTPAAPHSSPVVPTFLAQLSPPLLLGPGLHPNWRICRFAHAPL